MHILISPSGFLTKDKRKTHLHLTLSIYLLLHLFLLPESFKYEREYFKFSGLQVVFEGHCGVSLMIFELPYIIKCFWVCFHYFM